MRIDVTELLEKVGNVLELRMSERVSYPEDGLLMVEPVRSSVRLTNTGGSVLLQGNATTTIDLECGRCLGHFERVVQCTMEELYGEVTEFEEDNFISPIGADNTVDVGEAIRQNILLDLPMKPLCRDNCSP